MRTVNATDPVVESAAVAMRVPSLLLPLLVPGLLSTRVGPPNG